MQYLGFFLLVVASVGLVVGLLQHLKGKKILAAPFRKTGEIAQNPSVADAKGIVSCEGAIQASQPILAPCSGQPCVYFEIEVVREWQKHVVTEDGSKTEKGRDTIQTVKSGDVFYVNDGSGPVAIDPREGMAVELDKSFEQQQAIGWGDAIFGNFRTNVPPAGGDKNGIGVKVVEKIVPPTGHMFVMGQLANQAISKPKGLSGTLRASRKGRVALLGSTKRNALIGFIAGGVMFALGMALAIFADPPKPAAAGESACNILDQSKEGQVCSGKIYNDDGSDVPLTITQAGTFQINGKAPRGKKIPLMAVLSVKDANGKRLVENEHEEASVDLQPGKYTINVKDGVPGAAAHFKGGFSYEMSVKRTALSSENTPATLTAATPNDVPSSTNDAKPVIKAVGASIVKPAPATSAAKHASSAPASASVAASVKPATSAKPVPTH